MKVMEDYSTSSFILAFVRFACKVRYPKNYYLMQGANLFKGCQMMPLNFSDNVNFIRSMVLNLKCVLWGPRVLYEKY